MCQQPGHSKDRKFVGLLKVLHSEPEAGVPDRWPRPPGLKSRCRLPCPIASAERCGCQPPVVEDEANNRQADDVKGGYSRLRWSIALGDQSDPLSRQGTKAARDWLLG